MNFNNTHRSEHRRNMCFLALVLCAGFGSLSAAQQGGEQRAIGWKIRTKLLNKAIVRRLLPFPAPSKIPCFFCSGAHTSVS